MSVVIGENVGLAFKWLQNNADALKNFKMKRENGRRCLVRRNIPVKANVRKCEIVKNTHATGNVALEIVLPVSNHAISNYLVRIINVLPDATRQDVILVTKQKKYLASVAILDF